MMSNKQKNKIVWLSFFLLSFLSACAQVTKDKRPSGNHTIMPLSIGIIGSGNVGSTLGKKWAKAGYTIFFSSRHPASLNSLVQEAGANTHAVTVAEAVQKSDIIVLAVPFKAEAQISKDITPLLEDKILILCDNAYPYRDGQVAEAAKTMGVAYYAQKYYYPKANMVRAFSSLPVNHIASALPDKTVMIPYALDDVTIQKTIENLIRAVDGQPQYIGKIKESKSLDY